MDLSPFYGVFHAGLPDLAWPGAVAATKALLARSRLETPASLVDHAAGVFARAALGPEGSEGTAAFVQKRKPSWVPA